MQRGARALASVLGLCCAGAARADEPRAPPELTLAWQAPVGCPTQREIETQFARLLGGPARVPSGRHIDASAVVRTPAADRWTLELATVVDGATGRRNLAGDSCTSVSSAAALILALTIDPAAAARAVSADEPTPPPPLPRAPTVTAPAAPPVPSAPEIAFVARAFAGGVFALLPSPAPAAGVALGARRGRLGVEGWGLATLENRVDATSVADAGGDLRLAVAGARACGALGGRAVVWQLCLGGELEWLWGKGFGVDTPSTKTARMLAGTGGLLVTLPLGARVALSLDLNAAVRPYHPTFVLGPDDARSHLFTIPMASGFAALGVVITL